VKQWTVTGPHDETRHASAGAAWEAALSLFEDSDVDRVVMTDNAGRVAYTVTATDTDEKPRRCTLCGCDATGERFGFPVCTYHYDHTEDDPPCPTCAAGVAPDEWECPVCQETGCVHSREPHEGYC
jgi:rubredoxin